jgi:serine/threonine protein kinase
MAAAASQCPPADVIAAFAFGELSAANTPSVQSHVAHCEACLETVGHLASSRSTRSAAGSVDGAYRLLRKLGEGGMGEVWQAEQQAPVRRTVAVKLLKAGMDTRQIIARFEAERQLLALMQHPGIAQMFDAGITAGGRPYFVMEYVDGERITSYCDNAGLSVSERITLFQQVCDAVQHAHQKGVIHRDLKPSNVLVTMSDGRALPKVIDFGLAKLSAPQLADATLTEIGTVLGTPAYASPEQMSLGAIDVDTRSDVYSLGVLLYELLVGVLPFEADAVGPAALIELRASIRDVEPTRPSARVSRLGHRESNVAKARGMDAGALRRQLRGDLDWIVLKTLDKERSRRYESASALARDTQRYLEHKPVLASPPSGSYRLRKFIRRHRVGTAFASILLLLVVAFAVVSAMQVQRIAAERDRATSEAAKASSVTAFLQETLGSADPWQTGADISVRETLQRAAEKADASFKDQPLVAAALRRTIGKTYLGLGRLDEAERLMQAALDSRVALLGREHADVAESLADLADLYQEQGDYEAAKKAARESAALREQLIGNDHPLVAESLLLLTRVLKRNGEFDAALSAGNQALAIRERAFGAESYEVASVLEELGSVAASGKGELQHGEELSRRAHQILQKLYGPDDLRTVMSATYLGSIYLYQEKFDRAEPLYRYAMEGLQRHLGKSHPDTIVAYENLANALMRLKRFDEASALMVDVLAQRRAVLGEDNRLVARTMVNSATLLTVAGRREEAQAAFVEALPRFAKAYGPDHPDTASGLYAYGILLYKQRAYADAEKAQRQALAIRMNKLPDDHPDTAETRAALGKALIEQRQYAEAETLLTRAVEVLNEAYGVDADEAREASAALDKVRGYLKNPAPGR